MRLRLLIGFLIFVFPLIVLGMFLRQTHHELISLFPIQNYDQNISHWISSKSSAYDKPLLTDSQQKILSEELYRHYFATDSDALSPWNPNYIHQILSKKLPADLATVEQEKINQYSNKNKSVGEIGYGENFRPYTDQWINKITKNIHLTQFQGMHYDASHRGMAVDNLNARILPTDEVHFYSHTLAGEGYPFDNLQASSVWAGTPVYILGETLDHAWYLVLTPDFYIAWVKSTGIARVNNHFVIEWQQKAKHHLVGVTNTETPIIDTEDKIYRFSGYVGMIFPLENKDAKGIRMLIPIMDEKHQAHIRHAYLSNQNAALIPLQATIHQFVNSMSVLINRPYGWGNMYFYNDCSAELKNLYALFGIWLPRHSSEQVNPERVWGQPIDLSNEIDAQKRINFLTKNKHPFMTIGYIGGHVFMYLGNYPNPKTHVIVPLTYQNIWGLAPKPPTARSIIGQAVLFPLLKEYPEDLSLITLAGKKIFKMMSLDEVPQDMVKFRAFEFSQIDLRVLLSP